MEGKEKQATKKAGARDKDMGGDTEGKEGWREG